MTTGDRRIKVIGYWLGQRDPGWPDVSGFVDPTADADDRASVADRLDQGFSPPFAAAGWSNCRLCGARNGGDEIGDGILMWPIGLSHYIRDHQVRLPEIAEEMLRQPPPSDAEVRMAAIYPPDRNFDWWREITASGPSSNRPG